MRPFLSDNAVRARCSVFVLLLLLGATPLAAQGTATYRVDFDATWSAATHPASFPANPHFSGLIGGTHNPEVSFWDDGQLASLGIKRMAEWGSKTELENEVDDAIVAGTAFGVVSGSGVGTSPGMTSLDFEVARDFSLVTLVTMVAPSPDWFVGVNNLDLRPGGQWAQEIVVELYPWDAGTDSGVNYTSNDQATVPPEPVAPITTGPLTSGESLGTFTFTLIAAAATPPSATLAVTAYPNPFNPRSTIAWELPTAGPLTVAVYDAAGRLVREVWRGETAAGPGSAVWDGRDTNGSAMAAGTYFYRLRGRDGQAQGRFTMVK